MPLYCYINEKTGETVEVIQKMTDTHEYSRDGVAWKRVWLKPRMSVDSIVTDPYSSKQFVAATNKPDTIGSLWDRSAELSQKRADKDGVDGVKESFYDRYEATHHGTVHPERKKERGVKKLADQGINVEWGD